MARGVTAEVKNAAMKKLFADPHFNVMDRLDTYIDDYSIADPIPESMLRQMSSAKFLNLFDEKEQDPQEGRKPAAHEARDDADAPAAPDVAQSGQRHELPGPTADSDAPSGQAKDAHADLRLQPNDAAGTQDPGRGTA